MKLPDQWHELSESAASAAEDELRTEVIPGHLLYSVSATAIARRHDRDDFLFRIDDGSNRVAVVHLTWKRAPELGITWPITEIGDELTQILLRLYPDEMLPLRCPCCYQPTLLMRGGFEICPICDWEDDGQDDHDADIVYGGPNGDLSLTNARLRYASRSKSTKTEQNGGGNSAAHLTSP